MIIAAVLLLVSLRALTALTFSPRPEGPHLLDQAGCLALGHSLLILLLGNFLLLDVPRVGNAIDGPAEIESWGKGGSG